MRIDNRVLTGLLAMICLMTTVAGGQPAPRVRAEMLVTTSWLAGQLKNREVAILHVGTDIKAYESGHVPGALFFAFSEVAASRNGLPFEMPPVADLQALFTRLGIGDRKRIVVYHDSNLLMATRLIYTLEYIGCGGRAALLDGGLAKWKEEKRALETTTPTPTAADFTPRLRTEFAVAIDAVRDISWMAANLANPETILLDSRPGDQYRGSETARTGHIPGAANLYWMENVSNDRFQTLKPAAELKKSYAALGLTPASRVATYCNTGMQSSQTWFTLKYLGYDVRLYDGSMTEWSRAPNAQIVSGAAKK